MAQIQAGQTNCGRHDYGTYVLVKTGNLKLVMDSMGHADVKTAMKYQQS